MRDVLYDIVFLGIILLSLGGYYFYRDGLSRSLSRIDSFAAIQTAPSSICRFRSGDFQGASTGVMHVRNGRVLLDVTSLAGEYIGNVRVRIERNGTHIIDPATSALLSGMSEREQIDFIDTIIFSNTWKCAPWWLPKDAVFDFGKRGEDQ